MCGDSWKLPICTTNHSIAFSTVDRHWEWIRVVCTLYGSRLKPLISEQVQDHWNAGYSCFKVIFTRASCCRRYFLCLFVETVKVVLLLCTSIPSQMISFLVWDQFKLFWTFSERFVFLTFFKWPSGQLIICIIWKDKENKISINIAAQVCIINIGTRWKI